MDKKPTHNPPNDNIEHEAPLETFPCANPRHPVYTTSSIEEVVDFGRKQDLMLSWKPDGQPISLFYHDGYLSHAILCEKDGAVERVVTDAVRQIRHVPIMIPSHDMIEILGTAVVSWKNYNELTCENTIKLGHPGDLARNSVNNSDPTVCGRYRLEFIAFGMNQNQNSSKTDQFKAMEALGLKTVVHEKLKRNLTASYVRQIREELVPFSSYYPVNGLIFELDNPNVIRIVGKNHGEPAIALNWGYDVYSNEIVGLSRLYADLEDI